MKAQGLPCRFPVRVFRGSVNLLECVSKTQEPFTRSYVIRKRVCQLIQHIEHNLEGFCNLPARHCGGGRVERNGALRPFLTVLRQSILVAEELIVGVGELTLSPIGTNLPREHAPGTRDKIFLTPGLVEKCQGDQSGAIGNDHLQDGAALLTHGALLRGHHLGNQSHLLPHRDARNRGELTSARVTPGVVLQKISDRGIPKRFGQSLLGAIPQNPLQFGL